MRLVRDDGLGRSQVSPLWTAELLNHGGWDREVFVDAVHLGVVFLDGRNGEIVDQNVEVVAGLVVIGVLHRSPLVPGKHLDLSVDAGKVSYGVASNFSWATTLLRPEMPASLHRRARWW